MVLSTPLRRELFSRTMTSVTICVFSCVLILLSLIVIYPRQALATNATNSTLNFQARLENSTGAIVPDGTYNVQFKLYDGDTAGGTAGKGAGFAGTNLWTETWYDSNGVTAGNDNRVQVRNGYLSVSLGSQNAFSAINWDQNLWITMNIGGATQTATPTWDGEMNPRLKLTGVPFAFRAGQLAAFNSASDLTSTLSILQPTVGNQVFQIQDQGAAGTYNLCIQTSTACGFIGNQNSTQQTASNFWISGTGRADTVLQAPSFDTSTAVALNIGTTNATVINLNKDVTVAAGKYISLVGGIASTRPASPTEGMLYYDSTAKQLLVYANGKWQGDRSSSTIVVGMGAPGGCSGTVPLASRNYDSADYVVNSCNAAETTINTAIAALPAGGGTIYLMDGRYIAGGSITLPNNVKLMGSGSGTVIKFKDSLGAGTFNMIANSDTTNGNAHITVSDLQLDGNVGNNASGTDNGIFFTKVGGTAAAVGANISHVWVEDFRSAGIRLTGASAYSSITDSNITNNGAGGIGLFNSTVKTTVTGNIVTNNGATAGIWLSSSASNNTISGNTVSGGPGAGITLVTSSNNNTITGNTINSTTGDGITLDTVTGNSVTGNSLGSNGGNGVTLDTSTGNSIAGNTIISAGGSGVSLANSSSANVINGNNITASSASGIIAATSSNNNTISSNRISEMATAGSDGIRISSSANKVSDNFIIDNAGTGFAINITVSGATNNILSGNIFSGTGASTFVDLGTTTAFMSQLNNIGQILTSGPGALATRLQAGSSSDLYQAQDSSGNALFKIGSTGTLTVGRSNGASGVMGTIVVANSANNNTVTIASGATSGSYQLTLPIAIAATGDCLKAGTVAGGNVPLLFAACSAAPSVTLQGSTPGIPDTGNINISGTAIAGTTLLSPAIDSVAAGTLGIGLNNATTIQVGKTSGGVNQIINIGTNAAASATNTIHIGDGAANAVNTVTIGSLVGASATIIQAGTGNINLTTNQASAGVKVQTATNNSATAFQVQNAGNSSLLTVATDTNKIITTNLESTVAGTLTTNVNATTIDSTGRVGQPSSMKIGSDGFARISYYDTTNGHLKFAQCTNADCTTSNITTVDSTFGTGADNSLAIGSDGFGRISYYDDVSSHLKFVQCTNADCTTSSITTVDSSNGVGYESSIAMGTDGFARISYNDAANTFLKFIQCTNAACTTKNTTTVDNTAGVGSENSLAIGSDTFARISYLDGTNGNLKFIQCTNAACTTKVTTTVDASNNVSGDISLAIGSDTFARISYYDGLADKLTFAQCTNAACTTKNTTAIGNTLGGATDNSLAMGTDGFARITYFDGSNLDLKFVQCTNAACTTNNISSIDSLGFVGSGSSLAIGSDTFARISYYDIFHENLKFARLTSPSGAEVITGSGIGASSAFGKLNVKGIDLQGGLAIDNTQRTAPAISISGGGTYLRAKDGANSLLDLSSAGLILLTPNGVASFIMNDKGLSVSTTDPDNLDGALSVTNGSTGPTLSLHTNAGGAILNADNIVTIQSNGDIFTQGSVSVSGTVLTPSIDVGVPQALSIGSNTATSIDLNQNVNLAAGKLLNLGTGSIQGAGLSTDCSSQTSKLLWSSSTNQFSCGTDRGSVQIYKSADQSRASTTTLATDSALTFAVGANETWVIRMIVMYNAAASATNDLKYAVTAPAGATCTISTLGSVATQSGGSDASNAACGTSIVYGGPNTNGDATIEIFGTVANGATAGSINFQWAQNASSATATVVRKGSNLFGFKTTGADLAEAYSTTDDSIQAGDVVSIDPTAQGRVRKTTSAYDQTAIGIISTQPGQILADDSTVPSDRPVLLALTGRVPVKVTTENGIIRAGDYLTSSATHPGYAMKATAAGSVIGQALAEYNSDAPGTVMTFIRLSWYPGDASIQQSSNSIQNGSSALLSGLVVSGSADLTSLNVSGASNLASLAVTGNASFEGTLTVTGAVTIQTTLEVRGLAKVHNLEVNGHFITSGDAPLVSLLTAAGEHAAVTIDGNDTSGSITITTGDPGRMAMGTTPAVAAPTAGELLKLQFAQQFDKPPRVFISGANGVSSRLEVYTSEHDTSMFTLGIFGTPAAKATYEFEYFVVQ